MREGAALRLGQCRSPVWNLAAQNCLPDAWNSIRDSRLWETIVLTPLSNNNDNLL